MIAFEDELTARRPQWIKHWKSIGAWWMHDNNPMRPHVILTRGLHSNGFFNGGVPAEETSDFSEYVYEFCACLEFEDGEAEPTWVIGPAMGAIALAREISNSLNETQSLITRCGWADKLPNSKTKEMVIKRHDRLGPGDRVVVVEDTTSTTGTIENTIVAVEQRGATVHWVMCMLNRSPHETVRGIPITAMVREEMPAWSPDACELCKIGSEALRPKEGGNWERLTAEY